MKTLPVKRDFQVYPIHRQVKASKVRNFSHRLRATWQAFCSGQITCAEFDASIQGWINHVRYADNRGPRRHILGRSLSGSSCR